MCETTNKRPSVSGKSRVLRIPGGETKQHLNIATWNVQSLFEAGKLANTIKEMKRLSTNVLGVSETWWPDVGEFHSEETKVYYSGNKSTRHRQGVGIIVSKNVIKSVQQFIPFSDRALLLKINAKPISINIIQVYAPTADSSNSDIESFYSEISELLKLTKRHEMNIIMGDFNAKIGTGKVENIVRPFALGTRNDRGERLIQFCQEEDYKITNTWFSLPPRRLYTWKSPQDTTGNIVRNQIDFILINKRFSTSVKSVSTYPGADVPSDHNLLLAKFKIKLTVTRPQQPRKKQLDLDKLQNSETGAQTALEIARLRSLNVGSTNIALWNQTKEILNSTSKRILGYKNFTPKQKWMTEEIFNLMEQRRKYRGKNDATYKQIHRCIRRKIRQAKSEWLTRECEELERLQRTHDTFALHKKIKQTAGIYRYNIS
ncbi:craniofacial development protein 2-like [Condylostylus longicornis]|uniref:craniofacial development protein 2-like n=1 Tax=Condylostylus longicornis TaxID=2530218 RepID=UPI00244E3149|nr:craniofacial development protein 2-like [Condylostylus longicornis]